MEDTSQQLRVNRQTTEERVARLRNQALCELLLKHDHRAPEERAMRQELERDGGRDLVRHVRNAHVEVRQLRPQYITLNHLQNNHSIMLHP